MKRLDLYIFQECLPTFILSLTVFSFVLLVQKLADMFDLVVAKGVPLWEVARLMAMVYPTLLGVVLPVSLLLAVLLAMGRLSSDSEIVVMRACGVSLSRNLRPVFILSTLVMILCLLVTLWVAPTGRREFKKVVFDTVVGRLNVSAEAGTFTEVTPGVWLFVDRFDEKGQTMEGMFLHTSVGKLAGTVITAKAGTMAAVDGGLELTLTDAQFHQPKEDGGYLRTQAKTSRLVLPVNVQGNDGDDLTVREQSTPELYRSAFINGYERAEMEYHRRFTVPVSCLILGLLGGALGCHHFRSGNSRGLALCLVVLFLNYAFFTLGDALARSHSLPVWLAMWMPDILLALLAAYVIRQKSLERTMSFETLLATLTEKFKARFANGEKEA